VGGDGRSLQLPSPSRPCGPAIPKSSVIGPTPFLNGRVKKCKLVVTGGATATRPASAAEAAKR